MEGIVYQGQAPQGGGQALAGAQQVQQESGVRVRVVELLQFSVDKVLFPEPAHYPPELAKGGNQEPGCVVEVQEEVQSEEDNNDVCEVLNSGLDKSHQAGLLPCKTVRDIQHTHSSTDHGQST